MNYKKNLFYILIIFFSTISLGKSNENIAYLDLDNIVKSTKAGKSIINELKVSRDKALKKFEQKEKALKKITPLIEEYIKEKNIDIVLDKKDIFIANRNKDITNEIIKLIDDKIK